MKNLYILDNSEYSIELTRGQWAKIDEKDLWLVKKHKWHAVNTASGYYAATSIKDRLGCTVRVFMHRMLLNPKEGLEVDHKNRDTLDNRRENIRVATSAENKRNRRSKTGSTSKYCGVSYVKERDKWVGIVTLDDKIVKRQYFPTEKEALEYRVTEFVKMFGEDANSEQTKIFKSFIKD